MKNIEIRLNLYPEIAPTYGDLRKFVELTANQPDDSNIEYLMEEDPDTYRESVVGLREWIDPSTLPEPF